MSNILYIAPFLQNDNWGKLANKLLTLLDTKYNVAISPVYYIDNILQPNNTQMNLMNKKLDKIDLVIQMVLPSFFVKTKYPSLLAIPEDVMYQSYFKYINLLSDGEPIIIYDFPDFVKFDSIKPLDLPAMYDNYNIYYCFPEVGENDMLEETILAFSMEKNKYQDMLIISGDFDQQKTMEYINNLRKKTGRFIDLETYPEVCVISSVTEESKMAIHKRGHAYISTTKFISKYDPHNEYALYNGNETKCLNYEYEPIIKESRPFIDMFTCKDLWKKPVLKNRNSSFIDNENETSWQIEQSKIFTGIDKLCKL